jgi:hypothetical protein
LSPPYPPRAGEAAPDIFEIGRLLSHLLNITTQAMDVGALTPPLWGFEEREKLMVFYECASGAEILKRLPRAMPKPTTHIIDWFHIAMKIQPMQQIADRVIRSQSGLAETLPTIGRDIRAVKWRLWHGRVDRAIRDLEQLLASLNVSQGEGELSMLRASTASGLSSSPTSVRTAVRS